MSDIHLLPLKGFLTVLFLLPFAVFAQSSNPVGNAFLTTDNCYIITPNQNWQLGAVWFNETLDLSNDFDITLEVYLGNNPNGADGIVFCFQQVGVNALGEDGGGMGFEGFSPGLGIEIDTYQNGDYGDLFQDHLAIVRDGIVNHNTGFNLAGPVPADPMNANIADGQNHIFRVRWTAATETLDVFFDCELRLSHTFDMVNDIFGGDPNVWWGFTGATGGLANLQSACISEYALGLEPSYTVCEGGSVELGVVGEANGSYSWSPATYLDDPNAQNPVCTPEADISYTVTYTDLCGGQTQASTEVLVSEIALDVPEGIAFCEGESFVVEITGEADSFAWSNGDEGPTTEVSEAGTLSLEVVLDGCEAVYEILAEEIPNPVLSLDPSYTFCEGEALLLEPGNDGDLTYLWSDGSSNSSLLVEESGSYSVEVFNQEGCSSSISTEVQIIAAPESQLAPSYEACIGNEILLSPGAADTYLWSTGSEEAVISVTSSGNYSVVLSNGDCQTTSETEVTFTPLPVIDLPPTYSICADSTLVIDLSPNYAWTWEGEEVSSEVSVNEPGFFDIQANDLLSDCSASTVLEVALLLPPELNPREQWPLCEGASVRIEANALRADAVTWSTGVTTEHLVVQEPGSYGVTALNGCGEVSTVVEVVPQVCDCYYYVPNAFSPDLDGINEVFKPEMECDLEEYQFQVFNRWGEEVFSSEVLEEGWNGSGNSPTHYATGEVFAWRLRFSVALSNRVEVIEAFGHVVMLR